jgi:hypothetical protein
MNHYDELAFGNFNKLEAEWTKQKQDRTNRLTAWDWIVREDKIMYFISY